MQLPQNQNRLKSEDWEEVLPRTRGSHRKFAKEGTEPLTVPHSGKALRLKAVRSIALDAGWLPGRLTSLSDRSEEAFRAAERAEAQKQELP